MIHILVFNSVPSDRNNKQNDEFAHHFFITIFELQAVAARWRGNMSKVYIVSINGIANAGGVERVAYYLKQIFNSKDKEVIIVDKNRLNEMFLAKMLSKFFGRVFGILYPVLAAIFLYCMTKKSDIVITHGFNAFLYRADFLFCHGTLKGFYKKTGKSYNFSSKLLMIYEIIAANLAKKIIAVSDNAKFELSEYYKVCTKKIVVINNCVDCQKFYPDQELVNKNRQHINVIFCGWLDHRKGIEKLVELSEKIEKRVDINLLIATNNVNNTELFKEYKNTIVRVGLQLDDLNDFYNSGDIMYFPSLYEGFEMVTLEALASGIPVIGNHVGAIQELSDKHFVGVHLLNDSVDIISSLRQKAAEYKDYQKKVSLHERVKNKYGIDVYKDKLQKILFQKM